VLDGVEFVAGPWEAVDGAAAVVLVTEWDAYRALDLRRMAALLAQPVLVDLRNVYDRGAAEAAGLTYHAVGR
jgi:UDPglucose 6-dehydrogenase